MRLPVMPSDIITFVPGAERDRLGDEFLPRIGEVLIGTMLRAWDVADIRTAFIGLLRSAATSEQGPGPAAARRRQAAAVVGWSVPQYLHLEAAAGRSVDRHAGQVLTGVGSPKTTCPRRAWTCL
jgi:hypothetical protein